MEMSTKSSETWEYTRNIFNCSSFDRLQDRFAWRPKMGPLNHRSAVHSSKAHKRLEGPIAALAGHHSFTSLKML